MKRSGAVIAGYYGFGNAGDELILLSLLNHLRDEMPNVPVTVLSGNPALTRRQFGVEAVNRWHPWAWIKPLTRASRFILGGGGLLQESTGPANHLYYLSLALLAKLLGCRTEIRAVGVDPIQRWFNRWWTRFVINGAVDSVSVRDGDSQLVLESIGVRLAVLRSPDPVFQLTVPASPPEGERIALVVAEWPQRPGWEHDLAFLCDRLGEQLKASIDLIVFFPAEDEELARRVAQRTRRPVAVRVWTQLEELMGWFGGYRLVVSMRYHALVLSALAERPFIGWGYQRKVRSLCRDFGQPVWTFERGWDGDAVARQISEAWRQRDMLAHRYRDTLPGMRSATPTLKNVPKIHPAQV